MCGPAGRLKPGRVGGIGRFGRFSQWRTSQEALGATILERVGVECLPAGGRVGVLPAVAGDWASESDDGSPCSFWFPVRGP